ncbi:hypothetical protein ACNF42_06640 [Cuniculiplasma sp. SKW3]|uniref:hypothetical protein n=1 Tax=Cuniculiplasma sp. SKW3 TaxID=3400170 RepID=UPI003FD33E16
MERKESGVVNAYILNIMVHSDTLQLNEYDIRDRLEKRYNQRKNKRIRPQNVVKFHLDPLVKRHWLRKLPNGDYERIGELRHVKPRETLHDQFEGFTEEERETIIYNLEFDRRLFGWGNYEDSLTEEEYMAYMTKLYGESSKEATQQ